MALRDILVHLDGSAQGQRRLVLALDLARRHQAHLAGLFVVDVMAPMLAAGDAGSGAALAGLIEAMRDEALVEGARVEAAFREALHREAVAGEWRLAEGAAPELVALHARHADLVVLGQADPAEGAPSAAAMVAAALFDSGRPALVVPHAGDFPTAGRRVLVGWNASRESARAVNDALPLLAGAEVVTVSAVNPRRGLAAHGDEPGADIALHLARHGVKVDVEHSVAPEIEAADILLNRATELSADLLVVGAYGHSRLREMILGGVTRSLLRQMTVPVLMSH